MESIEVPKIADPLTLERTEEGPGGNIRPGNPWRPPARKKTPEADIQETAPETGGERLVDIVV